MSRFLTSHACAVSSVGEATVVTRKQQRHSLTKRGSWLVLAPDDTLMKEQSSRPVVGWSFFHWDIW